jgi:hypothetical protein
MIFDVTGTQRTFEMFTQIGLTLRSTTRSSVNRHCWLCHLPAQLCSETYWRRTGCLYVSVRVMSNSLSVWSVQAVDRFPNKQRAVAIDHRRSTLTCSRSFKMGATTRLKRSVEPMGDIIHRTMPILIQ